MAANITYIPSSLLAGETELIRERSFTRWMSRDLLQAANDFCRNIGLLSIYSECSPENLTRYLFWHLPQGAGFEIRSGRVRGKFEELDQANIKRGWLLLSLHINENDIYSAVWISPDHYEAAKSVLAVYGITAAERKLA